jgi:hypothetical protein
MAIQILVVMMEGVFNKTVPILDMLTPIMIINENIRMTASHKDSGSSGS